MAKFVPAEEWQPVDGQDLEAAAWQAVRSSGNCLVIAGPGSGKSELLAQRANFLLETGTCRPPQRILAICFKKDAASNLARRVEIRCRRELAARFDCRTYHAFAKSLVDQFRATLPATLRPTANYQIEEHTTIAIQRAVGSKPSQSIVNAHNRNPVGYHPSVSDANVDTILHDIFKRLVGMSPSVLTFPMIINLAEIILHNPVVKNAVRATYSHVFLDEFQDTTRTQYALLCAAFDDSSKVTAVGDHRQRIMVWAGAFDDVFHSFCSDFKAERVSLSLTHRAAVELLDVQRALASRISDDKILSMPGSSNPITGSCELHAFMSYKQEAAYVAEHIQQWIQSEGLSPRQICILAKQRVDLYSRELVRELANRGVKARLEVALQDILAEPAWGTLLSLMRLTMPGQWFSEYENTVRLLVELRGADGENTGSVAKIERDLDRFLHELEHDMGQVIASGANSDRVEQILIKSFNFLGSNEYRSLYRQYSTDESYQRLLSSLSTVLTEALNSAATWLDALEELEGRDCVPIMTIHKSKGLEFDAVVFIGLEDGAFWSFDTQSQEDTCALYVALTRAKRRIWFTYSKVRNSGTGGADRDESFRLVGSLYDTLKAVSNVRTVRHTKNS